MAGPHTGAPSPRHDTPSSQPAGARRLRLVPASTRTRRNHGVITLGGHLACVYSARQAGACYGVTVEVGAGTLALSGAMTPAQARSMARALIAAADAVDAVRGAA